MFRVIISFMLFILAASAAGNTIYNKSDINRVRSVSYGVITHIRAVKIKPDDSYVRPVGSIASVGSLGGAAIGGILGHSAGGGRGKDLATAAGVIAGSLTGQQIQKQITAIDGQELEIRKEDGNVIVIIQTGVQFNPGQRVAITGSGNNVEVSAR